MYYTKGNLAANMNVTFIRGLIKHFCHMTTFS